jgi:uncharacterized protein (DUF433 family)
MLHTKEPDAISGEARHQERRMQVVEETAEFIRHLDARELPRYTAAEAARYLGMPGSTLHAWFYGTVYGRKPSQRRFLPILQPASKDLLSFFDVASAHVLLSLKSNQVPPDDLRTVVNALRKEFPESPYPLLGKQFFMFGREIVIRRLDELLNLTRDRQLGIKAVMERFLSRLEVDEEKMPLRFSPIHSATSQGEGIIVIDPNLSNGRPVIRGTGVAVEVIVKRSMSGESRASLARDYRLSTRVIEEAIRYYTQRRRAA